MLTSLADVIQRLLAATVPADPSKNIAADLGLRQRTIESHRAAIMEKTGSKSLPALARLALAATWTGSDQSLAMTALPHKRIDALEWVRDGADIRLRIESGKSHDGIVAGIPFGYVARLILLYLQTEAIKTRSREVELGCRGANRQDHADVKPKQLLPPYDGHLGAELARPRRPVLLRWSTGCVARDAAESRPVYLVPG